MPPTDMHTLVDAQLKEESDYCLFTVVVFKKCAEEFKHACREKCVPPGCFRLPCCRLSSRAALPTNRGYQIREISHDAHASTASAAEVQRISADMAARKASLLEWCRTAFGEAFAALLHVAAVRLFVESILRYGLPPCFATALCCVDKKHEKRLRGVLTATFGRNASIHWKQREEDASKGEEVHPYVSLTLALPQ